MPDGVVVSTDEGVPQGGPLSPLLSNIVLDELDRELERRGHRFVRYADDCNIYVRSERSGQRVMASIVRLHREPLAPQGECGKERRGSSGETALPRFQPAARAAGRNRRGGACRSGRETESGQRIRELTPRTWGQSLARLHPQGSTSTCSAGSASSGSAPSNRWRSSPSSTRTSDAACVPSCSDTGEGAEQEAGGSF